MRSLITSGFDMRLCTIGLSSICRIMSGLDMTCCCICAWISAKLELPRPNEPRPPPRPPPNGKLNKLLAGCCAGGALDVVVVGCCCALVLLVVDAEDDVVDAGVSPVGFTLITKCTVTPSFMPCCNKVSWSFRILPEKIKHSWSLVFENFLPTSSFSYTNKQTNKKCVWNE